VQDYLCICFGCITDREREKERERGVYMSERERNNLQFNCCVQHAAAAAFYTTNRVCYIFLCGEISCRGEGVASFWKLVSASRFSFLVVRIISDFPPTIIN